MRIFHGLWSAHWGDITSLKGPSAQLMEALSTCAQGSKGIQ